MSIKKHSAGTLEVSGADLLKFRHVIDENLLADLAGIAARRAQAARNRKLGMSVRTARKMAQNATPTAETMAVVRVQLQRGACPETAVRAGIRAENLRVVQSK